MELQVKMNGFEKILSEDELEKLKQVLTDFTSESMKSTTWDDNVFLPPFSAETAQYCYKNLHLKKGDVLISTFPKCGTIWTAEIVQRIIYQDQNEYELSLFPHHLMCLEVAPSSKFPIMYKIPLKRRLAVSHMQAKLINVEKYTKEDAKMIYVLRNPKDQMVSMHKFLQVVPNAQVEPILSMHNKGWDKFFQRFVQGDMPITLKPGEWYPDHILSWYQHKDNKNVYFIYYEDMIKDLEGQIKLLAKFLESPVTDEKAKQIATACSFENMKKNRTIGKDFMSQLTAKNMRKGGVGGWKDHFTVSQSEQVDAIMKEKLKDTDIKFTYEL